MSQSLGDDYARAPGERRVDFSRSGKWLVFCSAEHHDEVWGKIKTATEAGTLGDSAKTTGLFKPSPRQEEALKARYPNIDRGHGPMMCVYTYDSNDHVDVRRVLIALRALGIGGRLSYKTDAETIEGRYGAGVSIYVSQPGSLDFKDRRPAR